MAIFCCFLDRRIASQQDRKRTVDDGTATKNSAGARADWVSKGLKDQPAAHGITIKPLPLPQHARCGKAPNLRAVYPFLFHAENSPSRDSRP